MKLGQNQIGIGVILVLVGVSLYLAMDLNRFGRERVIEQFNTMQLLLAREVAHEAALHLKESAGHLEALAQLDSLQSGDPQRMAEVLADYHRTPGESRPLAVMVINTNGDVVLSNNGAVGANFSGSTFLEWSKQPTNQRSTFVSSWIRVAGATNGMPPGSVFLATPWYQSSWDSGAGRMVPTWAGIVVISVDMEKFLAKHVGLLAPKGSHARIWIMDHDGTILLQSEHPEMVNASIFRPQPACAQCHVSFEYAHKMLDGRTGTTEYQLKEQPKKLAAFVPLEFANASWIMVVNAPYDEVTAFLGQSYHKTLLLLGTVVAALVVASVLVYRTNLSRARATEEVRHWQQKLHLEEQLRRAEVRYRTLFEQSPDGIVILDPDTLLPIEFNDAAHRRLGYTREEFGRKCAGDHLAHGTPEETRARFTGLLPSGNARFEQEVRSRQGELRTVEFIVQALNIGDRTLVHCIHHDITERKRAEDTLTGRSAQLEALHQASLSITAEMETGNLLQAITRKSLGLFQGSSAELWMHGGGAEQLEWAVGEGKTIARSHARLSKGQSLAGRCWEVGAPLVVADRLRWEGGIVGEECTWRAAMAAPLRWGEFFLGVLEIRADTAGSFTRDDASLLGLFATQAAIALKNAGLLEQVRRDENIKTTLLHDVSHRVKNNLARLLEIIRLERDRARLSEPVCCGALVDLEHRLRGMEVIHTMLSTSQWQPLILHELVTQILTGALSGSPIREQIHLTVLTPGEALRVVPEQATALALILSELASNSVKYAFDNRTEGRMEVRLRVERETKGRPLIRLQFRDDGPGWPEDVLNGQRRHVGLSLIQASVCSPLRGEMTLRNDGGAVAEVAFKLALIE